MTTNLPRVSRTGYLGLGHKKSEHSPPSLALSLLSAPSAPASPTATATGHQHCGRKGLIVTCTSHVTCQGLPKRPRFDEILKSQTLKFALHSFY